MDPDDRIAVSGAVTTPSHGGVDQTANPTVANIRQYKVGEAARNVPRAGSVTQSSDADGSHVTRDSVNVEVSAVNEELNYVVSYGGEELLSTKNGTEATGVAGVLDRPAGTHLYERVEGGVEFYRSLEAVDVEFGKHGATQRSLNLKPGDVWVDVYTDFQAEESTDTDADYLARGIWVYVPDDATNLHDYEYGAFADGNDPFVQDNLAGLAGTATYVGEDSATGLYANAAEQQNEFFEADVTLMANFGYGGELGSIEGRIHDIQIDGAALPGNPQLALRNANIGANHSGFFDGDTGMTFEGKSFTGKWGGQFFSNGASSTDTPGSVAGTFGAATEGGRESFLGSFSAYGAGDGRTVIDLTRHVKDAVDRGKSPALFAAVIDAEGIKGIGAAGVRKQGSPEEVTVNDLVHLGSLTKSMTSTMLATLVEDGTLPHGWNTTIADVFPELLAEIHEDYHSVELSQLVRMRGGIARDAEDWWSYYYHTDVRPRRYAIVRDNLMRSPAGSVGEFLYSNLSYMIAGAMAERLTGKSWETLMEERVFTPLGMATAGFGAPGTPDAVDQPWGHRRDRYGRWAPNQYDNPQALGPAGTVHMSIADWAKYIRLWFADENPAILDRRTLADLIASDSGSYGAGWNVVRRDWAGGVTLTHDGSNLNWYAVLWIAADRGFALLAVANSVENDLDDTVRFVDSIVYDLIVKETAAHGSRLVGGGGSLNTMPPTVDFKMIDAANARPETATRSMEAVLAAAASDALPIPESHLSRGGEAPVRVQAVYGVDGPSVSAAGYTEVGGLKRTARGHEGRELRRIETTSEEDGSTVVRTSYVAGFTDVEAPTPEGNDKSYLTWGFWMDLEDASATGVGVDTVAAGVFVEGSSPAERDNLVGLTGTVRYQGEATGLYADDDGVRYFDATASLTADFGDDGIAAAKGGAETRSAGTIRGTIFQFNIGGTPTPGTVVLGGSHARALGDGADIDATSATFTGKTSGTLAGHALDDSSQAGWGGRFFTGNQSSRPEYVAGTFGASTPDERVAVVGAFGAGRREE